MHLAQFTKASFNHAHVITHLKSSYLTFGFLFCDLKQGERNRDKEPGVLNSFICCQTMKINDAFTSIPVLDEATGLKE